MNVWILFLLLLASGNCKRNCNGTCPPGLGENGNGTCRKPCLASDQVSTFSKGDVEMPCTCTIDEGSQCQNAAARADFPTF